ncbi:hypothetical protein, partial [Mycolicibacillus koreensis]
QIILGKVRPFLRRLAETHPQVLIIAPGTLAATLQRYTIQVGDPTTNWVYPLGPARGLPVRIAHR